MPQFGVMTHEDSITNTSRKYTGTKEPRAKSTHCRYSSLVSKLAPPHLRHKSARVTLAWGRLGGETGVAAATAASVVVDGADDAGRLLCVSRPRLAAWFRLTAASTTSTPPTNRFRPSLEASSLTNQNIERKPTKHATMHRDMLVAYDNTFACLCTNHSRASNVVPDLSKYTRMDQASQPHWTRGRILLRDNFSS